jgi:hypothetical protein
LSRHLDLWFHPSWDQVANDPKVYFANIAFRRASSCLWCAMNRS